MPNSYGLRFRTIVSVGPILKVRAVQWVVPPISVNGVRPRPERATGGTESPLLTLMLLPLTAAAVALGRWMYGVFVLAVVGAAFALGYATPEVVIASSAFFVWLVSALAPAIIATTAIALLI